MADAKGRARKKTAKAGGAFGALRNLQETGALAAIEEPAAPVEPAPARASSATHPHSAPPAVAVTPSPDPPAEEVRITAASLLVQAREADTSFTEAPVALAGDENGGTEADSGRAVSEMPEAEASVVPAGGHQVREAPPTDQSQRGSEDAGATWGKSMAVRRASVPGFPTTTVGQMQPRVADGLPTILAGRVDGLPEAYLQLAKSYRQSKSLRTGSRAKRNVRLHSEIAEAITRQLVSDKKLLRIRDLKPSHYVDAALTFARGHNVETLIAEADNFRDRHLGEGAGLEAPNHYSISQENDVWLNDMIDELLLARATGLHGHMINVVIEAYLHQLSEQASEG